MIDFHRRDAEDAEITQRIEGLTLCVISALSASLR
jgi:hypothetical protein